MVNKVILVGRVGQEPEEKSTQDGNKVISLSVATSEKWVDKTTQEKKQKTEWHRVVIFGGMGDIVSKYCKKGQQVYIEGKLTTSKYTGQDGTEKSSTSVVLSGFGSVFQILDKIDASTQSTQAPQTAQKKPQQHPVSQLDDVLDDDIPF